MENSTDTWLILAVILAGAGGILAAVQRGWATVLVAVAVLCVALPAVL